MSEEGSCVVVSKEVINHFVAMTKKVASFGVTNPSDATAMKKTADDGAGDDGGNRLIDRYSYLHSAYI